MSKEIAIAEIRTMANSATQSGMFPVKNPEQAFTLMLIAQAENIHPMSAFMKYDIIQGKPALKSSEVLSRFQQSGGKVEWITTNEELAKGKFTHPQGGSITIEWNMQRATKAGYATKDNWRKHPAQMLRARCVTEAVRAIYPSCLNNMYSVDEVSDFSEEEQKQEEVIETVEVVDTGALKRKLWNKLTKFNVIQAEAKGFFEHYDLENKTELLEKLANDDKFLEEKLEEFENGN